MTYARTRTLYGARSYNMPSRFIDELPAGADRRRGGAAGETSWSDSAPESAHRRRFRSGLGDDVVHATFGEGVVTGMQQGGIVTVHFAADRHRTPADGRLRAAAPRQG